mgnify:CR=1 FL=1
MLEYLGKSYLNACLTISCDCIGKNSCDKKWLTLRLDREDRLAVQVVRYTATWRGYGIRRSLTCRRCCTVWNNCHQSLICNLFSLPNIFFLQNTCRSMSLYFTRRLNNNKLLLSLLLLSLWFYFKVCVHMTSLWGHQQLTGVEIGGIWKYLKQLLI